LGADDFLGGKYRLDFDAAFDGIDRRIAKPLGIDTVRAAEGINRLVNSTMADAIRLVSIGAGYDPRQCVLIVAGGAGAVHAAAIAHELGIRKLLVPREASVFCAAGMLLSDLKHDYVRNLSGELSRLPREKIHQLYGEMEAEALETLGDEGVGKEDIVFCYGVDLKYAGQFHELTIPFNLSSDALAHLKQSFDAHHQRLYGYHLPDQPVEALHWRLSAIGQIERPSFSEKRATGAGKSAGKRNRAMVFDGLKVQAKVFDGAQLSPPIKIHGPAIIEEPTTTVVVPPRWELSVNRFGDYELSIFK
jgi:N-methylhydantoinase A